MITSPENVDMLEKTIPQLKYCVVFYVTKLIIIATEALISVHEIGFEIHIAQHMDRLTHSFNWETENCRPN